MYGDTTMKTLQTTIAAFALFSTSSVFAIEQCPDYLPTKLMTDCIIETGADRNYDTELTGGQYDAVLAYKEWRKAQAKKLEALDDYTGTPAIPVAQNAIRN
jgi:hypothetical protein